MMKNYLSQTFYLHQQMHDRLEQLTALRQSLQGLESFYPVFDDQTPSLLGIRQDILALEKTCQQDLLRWQGLYQHIERLITGLDDPTLRLLLTKRYLLLKTWQQIADELGYSRIHVHRLHQKALNALTATVEDTFSLPKEA
jgi:DNA-directed RNA polymerase specialized sigma subunit